MSEVRDIRIEEDTDTGTDRMPLLAAFAGHEAQSRNPAAGCTAAEPAAVAAEDLVAHNLLPEDKRWEHSRSARTQAENRADSRRTGREPNRGMIGAEAAGTTCPEPLVGCGTAARTVADTDRLPHILHCLPACCMSNQADHSQHEEHVRLIDQLVHFDPSAGCAGHGAAFVGPDELASHSADAGRQAEHADHFVAAVLTQGAAARVAAADRAEHAADAHAAPADSVAQSALAEVQGAEALRSADQQAADCVAALAACLLRAAAAAGAVDGQHAAAVVPVEASAADWVQEHC